ncbi:MAG: DinB family protein [Candidatus Acidiferrales bacterium]
MRIGEMMLGEFDREMANTRKTLERVPYEKFGWKPHDKSGTMGWLAGHLADIPGWVKEIIERTELDVAPVGGPPHQPRTYGSVKEVLERFDKHVIAGRGMIAAATDEHLMQPWTLLAGGHKIFTLPRVDVLRSMMMNHMIHHRAQLGVYLRLNSLPVPAIYGPSADEK